ncbi:MAG: DUF721 domain-containing protein [Bacteroidales bacterium]|nr:DUF721 domain-containing protein [Bacteroidales bacterium]
MKNSNEQKLKEAIEELLVSYKLQDGLYETKLINSWEGVAGKLITKHTEKLFIKRKTLYIKLDSPALKNELSFARTKLIKSLNKAVNKEVIQDIKFI